MAYLAQWLLYWSYDRPGAGHFTNRALSQCCEGDWVVHLRAIKLRANYQSIPCLACRGDKKLGRCISIVGRRS